MSEVEQYVADSGRSCSSGSAVKSDSWGTPGILSMRAKPTSECRELYSVTSRSGFLLVGLSLAPSDHWSRHLHSHLPVFTPVPLSGSSAPCVLSASGGAAGLATESRDQPDASGSPTGGTEMPSALVQSGLP